MLLFISLCKLYDSLTTNSWSWPLKYSLLIQMDLSSSICNKNGKTLLHFQSVTHGVVKQPMCLEWLHIRCFSFTAFLWFVLHRLNYLRYHFAKRLPERGFLWKRKNYLVFEHAFLMVVTFFERNLHYVIRGRHARVSMSRVHQSVARA